MKRHGMHNTRLYRIWNKMHQRCTNPNEKAYERYGARGITICPEWRADFVVFHDWAMKNGYEEHLTIDRKDPNGNYDPSNCRWATMKEQQNNKRNNIYIEIEGVAKTAVQWSDETGIPSTTIRERYKKHGANPNILFSKDTIIGDLVYINGIGKNISVWAREVGISRQAMHARIKKGVTGEDLLKLKTK